MNIFQLEANDIRKYLGSRGYRSVQGADHIIVFDPAGSSVYGLIFTEVAIRDWPAAIKFIEERS